MQRHAKAIRKRSKQLARLPLHVRIQLLNNFHLKNLRIKDLASSVLETLNKKPDRLHCLLVKRYSWGFFSGSPYTETEQFSLQTSLSGVHVARFTLKREGYTYSCLAKIHLNYFLSDLP